MAYTWDCPAAGVDVDRRARKAGWGAADAADDAPWRKVEQTGIRADAWPRLASAAAQEWWARLYSGASAGPE